MIQKIKTLLLGLSAGLMLAAPVALTASVAAQGQPDIQNSLCAGANLSTQNNNCAGTTADASQHVNDIITTVINVFSLVVGVVAVIMIIVGGFRYITSGGDTNNVSGAKNTILYAIVGLVIVALAQIIVKFVLGKVTGTGG